MSNLSDYLSLPPNESSITNLDVVSTAPNIPFPTTESQAKGSSNDNLSLDNYLNSPATLETRMAPTPFDWNKSQADRFVQNSHYTTEGFNPYADNELKYAGVQTWGDVMSNAIGGSWSLAKNTFVEGWRGWSNLGSALFNWSTDQTFMERLAGSPEELMQRDEEQKDIFNKYAIYKSPVKDTGFGIFNREFIGDMIQQGGFSLGAGAQFLSEMALTWGIGEGFGAIAKSAGWLAKGVKGAEDVKNALTVAEKARQVGSTGEVINAARKATDPTALKSFAKNFREYAVKAGSWAGDQFNVIGGIDKAVKAYEAGASTYQLASMGVGGITRAFAALNTATTEARFEAASTYGGMYASLMDEWQQKHNGELPQGKDLERIQKTAYASATDVFGTNTALLMAFNQIQYGNIMSKFGSSSRLMREALEKGEGELFTVTGRLKNAVVGATEAETIKEGTKASKAYLKGTFGALSNFNEIRRDFGLGTALYQVGKRVGKFETAEGIQEILQSTTDTTFRDYYTNLYHGGKDIEGNSFIKDITSADWSKGLQSQLTMEGWQTFMMGAVTGLFMNPLQAGVMQGFKKANAGVNAQYKGEADAHKKMMQDSKTILNTWYNDPKKSLSEHIAGLKVQGKADQNMMDAVYNGDKYEFHNAKDDAFTNALEVAIKTGNYKSFVDSIKELGERLTDEEFAKAFSLDAEGESKVSARSYTQSIVREIESYYDNRERLMNEFGHLVQPELYAHDGEMYKSALFAKKSLDEAIGLLATTSYHATRTIERATELRAAAAALPTIGTSANKVFEVLGNIATAEMELGRLEEELETYKGLESDKTVATKIANTKEQIKHLEDWIMNYRILESHRKGERGKTTPFVGGYPTMYKTMQAMIDSHTGYLTAINNEYSKVTGVPDRREMMKSFNLLMDYDKLNRDNAQYVSALNVLSDPRGFNILFDKISNALYTNSAKLRAEHLEESRKRISAITGVDPDDINTEDEEETKRTAENIRQEKTLSSLLKKTEQEITDLLNRSTENEKEVNASIESIKQIQNQIVVQQNILSTLSDQKDLIKETKKVIKSLKKELVTLNKTVKDLQKEKVNISKTLERLEYLKDSYSAAILQLQESTVTFQEINKIEKGLLNRLRKEQLVAPGVELTQMINDLQQQLDAIDSNITAHYAIIATTQKLIDELTFFVTQPAEGITDEQLSTYRENLEFTKKKLKDTALAIDALIQDRDSVARKLYNGELALEQRENIEKLKGHMKYVKIVTDALEEAGVKNEAFQTPEGSTLSPEEKQAKGESEEDEILNEIIAFYSTPKKPSAPPTPPAPAAPAAGGATVVANPPVIVRTDEGKVDLQKMMDEVLATGTLVSYNPLELKGETQDLIEQIEAVADETNVLAKIVKTKATGTPVTPTTETPVEPTSTLSAEAEEYLNNNPDLKSKLEATKAGLEDNTKTEKQAAKEVEDAINTVKTAPKAKVGPDEMLSFPDLPGNPAVQKITDEIFRVPVINKYQSYSTVEEANAALREWVKKNYPTAKEMTPAERKIFTARKNALAKFRKQFNAKSFFANPDLQDLSNDDFTYIFDNTSSYEHFVRSMFVTKDEKLRNASDYYGYDERTDKTYLDKWQDLITEEEYNQALAAYVSGLNKIDEVYDKKVVDLNTSLTPEEKQRELIRMEGDRLKRNIRYFPEKLFYNHITGRTSILGNVYVMMRTTNHFNVATEQQAIDSIDKYIGEKLAKLEGVNVPETVTETETETGTEEGTAAGSTTTTGPVSDIKSFETAKGSIYTYDNQGRTVRSKTATGEEYLPQDLTVFVKFESLEQQQDFLAAVQDETGNTKVYVIDNEGNKYNTNQSVKGKDVRLVIADKDGNIINIAEISTEPVIGYNTFDQRRFTENGESYREVHIGNKVTKINRKTTSETKPTAGTTTPVSDIKEEKPGTTEESLTSLKEPVAPKLLTIKNDVSKMDASEIRQVIKQLKDKQAQVAASGGVDLSGQSRAVDIDALEKYLQEKLDYFKAKRASQETEIVTGTEPDPTAISTEIVERLEMIGLKLSNEEMALIPYLTGTKKITAEDNINIKDLTTLAKRIADSLSEMIGLEHPVGDTGYVFNNKDQGSEFAVTELFLNGRYDKVLNGETEGEESEDMFEPEDSEVNNVVPTPRVYSTTQITLAPYIDFDALWKDDELWNDGGKSPEQRQEENKKNGKLKVPSAIYSLYDKKSKRERSKLFLELSQDNIYDRVKIEFTATPGKTYPYNLYFYVDDQIVGWVNTLNNTEQPGIDLINILKAKLQKAGTSQIVVTGTELEEIVKFTVGKGSLDLVKRNPDGSYQKGIPFNQVLFNSESETGDPIVQRITETGEDFVSGSSDDVPSDAEDQSLYTGAYRALIKFPNGNSYWIQLSHRQLTPAEVDNTIRQINEQAAKAYSGTITNNEIKAINKQLANIFPTINVFEENADKKGLKIYLTLDPGNKAAGISGGRKLTVAVQYQMGATKKVEFAEIKQPSGGAVSFTDVNDLLARINNAVNTINQRKTLPEVPPVTEKSLKEQIPLENSLPYIMRMTTNVTTPNVVGVINFGINVVSNFPGLNDQANTVARDVKEDKTAKGGGAVVEPNTPTAQEKINPNAAPPATDIDSMPTSTEDEYNKYLDALEKEDEANKNAKKANKILKGSPVFSAKSVENIETFSKWVKDKLPQDVISIEEIDTLIANLQDNNITVGEFIAKLDKLRQIKGVIKVAKESPFKYHEAFHAVFRLLLTQDQINGLLAEARKEFPITEEGLEELRTLTPENQKLTRKQLEELYLEEKMADRFDTYMMNKKAPVSSGIKAFFQKLLRFIQNFFKRFTPSDIETLFADIDAGKYKNSTIQDNSYTNDVRTNPLGFTLPACKVIKLGTDEIILPNGKKVFVDVYMPQKQADKLVATITAQFDQEVRNKNLKEYNSENILNNILNVYKATYNPRRSKYFDVQSKITNPAEAKAYTKRVFNMHNIFSQKETRNAIKESVAASLRVLGYEVTLDALENDKITDTYGPRSSDKFDKRDPGAAAGPEGKAQELRRFIAGTTTFTVDEFGNTHYENGEPIIEAVNAGDVYNGILKLLANTSSQKKQIKKLRDFVKMNVAVDEATGEERIIDNKHSVATIKRLFELTGYNSKTNSFTANQEMVNMFLKGFSSYSANYLFTQVDPNSGKTVTTYANTKDSSVVQVKSWNDAFSRVYEDLMRRQNSDTEYAALYKSKNQGISQFKEAVNESSKKKLQSDAVINNKARSISTLLKRDLGIVIHPNYIKYSILKSKEQDALNSDQLDFLETFGELEPITETMFVVSLTNTLSKGISPFGKDMYVVEGEDEDQVDEKDNTPYNILLKIAQNNSIFDETIGTISFTTSDNETRYAHTHPNFYYVNVSELNDPQVIEKIRKDVEKNTVHLLSNDDFIALLNNKAVKVNMAEGLKSSSINSSEQSNTNKKGTVYGDFVRRDNLAYLLAMYDISKKKDAKVSRSSEAEDFFYKTGHLIRTVESKKAGYFVDLPVLNAVVTKDGKTSLSDTALDILYNTVLYEIDRIARVNQEITTGKDENGKPVKEIMDYNQGALRGLKLYETANMLGDLAADIEKNAIDPNYVPDKDAILEQLNKYWMDQVDRFIEMMRKEGLINDKNQRVLAPQYLFKGFTGKNADVMNRKMYLIKNEFVHNVAQVFMNDFLNTSAINKLLHGDESKSFKLFVDQVKRAAGANAAGPSIESIVTKPEWGIDHEVVDVHHVTYEDTEFLKRSGEKGQQDDGQMYCTAKGLRYMLFGMGTLKQVQVDILNKIEQGLPVTKEEFFKAGGIQDMKAAFNPLKMVYFDGSTYLKCSVQMLSKEFTSYWSKSKGKWVAYPGKENLHNLREKMEKFEKKKKTITFAHPVSASKGMKQNVASDINTIADSNFNKLPAMYMRQQLENPSGKTTMTDPTQKLQQIFAEIPAKSKVFINGKEVSGKEAVDNYLDLIAKRAAVNYKLKRNGIFDIKDAFNEISMSYQTGQVTPKLAEFYDLCYENLMATGADSQTLEFFRTKDNQTVYNLNFPATLQKYTQLFLAYFSNGAFQAKVPGLTLTLISNAHHKIIKRLISVDENGQPKEWEVITREMFNADPEKYTKSLIRYSEDQDGTTLKRMFTGLEKQLASGKPVYYLDDLRDNVGVYNEDGERISVYSEYITASHYEEEDDSAVESSFSVRIPSDDKHSYMNARRVDLLPIWMGSTGMFPQEIMEKSGTDFDLDKVYVSIPDTYAKGNKRVAYGSATTDIEKFEEYITWQYNNNKAFKNKVNASMKEDSSFQEVLKEQAELKETKNSLISKINQSNRDIEKEKDTRHVIRTKYGQLISAKGIYVKEFEDVKKQLLKNFNESVKGLDELKELIKETRDWHILKVLAEMKMPASVAEFNKEGGENNNPGVINNKILVSNQSLLSSDAIAGGENPILNQPTSTEAFNTFASTIKRELAGATNEYAVDLLNRITDKKEDTNSMLGKEISRDTNAQGRDNIGAAANAVINYSINSTFGLELKGPKIIIDGKEYTGYGNTRAWDGKEFNGERVFASLSAIENAMTDNAKYAYSGKYGLNIGAVGYLSNMVSQGIPFETAMLFIIQPTVQEYFKRISNLSSNLKTTEESSLSKNQIMEELEMDINAQKISVQKEEEGEEQVKKYDPTSREGMIDNIRNNKMSLEIFKILKVIDKQSMDLMDFSKILKITQGLPVSWEEFDDIKKAMNKFGLIDESTEEKDLSIDVKEIMQRDHKFMAEYIKMFRDLDALSGLVFVERNPQFMQVMDIVKANFAIPLSEMKNFNNTLKMDLLSYFSISAYKEYLDKEALGAYLTSLNHAMIYPELLAKETNYEDAIDIVLRLKKKFAEENTPNYFINYILNIVDAGNDVSKINKIEINSWAKLSPYQQEKIMDSYLQLYSNKDTHIDAVALFHYLLVKDGGQFKSGSFIRYIHNGVFKNLLNSTSDVNRLLSDKNADDNAYREVFGKTLSELVDGFLKSYATYVGNENYVKQTKILAPTLKNKNSPIYLDKESKVLYVDYKMGMDSVKVDEGDSKFMNRLMEMYNNGFAYEFEELVSKEEVKETDEKKKKKKIIKISFPYSIIINNQLYILQAVDKDETAGEQDFTKMLGVDQNIAKGSRARYVQGKFRGSNAQWGGAAVFGKMPIREEIVVREQEVIDNPPYSPDVPSPKNIVTKTEKVIDTGTKTEYDESAVLGTIKNPYKVAMNLKDGDGGRKMKAEFKGKSTMDLILSGHRTGTSRDMSKDYNRLPVKEGDFIEFSDTLGRKALVRVTEPWISIKTIDAESWSDIEGWDQSVYKGLLKKEGQYKQLQFVLVNTEEKGLVVDNIEDLNEKAAIDALRDQFGLFVYRIGQGTKYGIKKLSTGETFERDNITPQQMLEKAIAQSQIEEATEEAGKQTAVPGVESIPNTGITVKQGNEFIDLIQPQIAKQAYVENKARTANMMFSFGLRWAKNIPNESEKSEQAKNVGKPRPDRKPIKSKEGVTYGYYLTDQNNNPLPSVKELQPIIDFIQSKLGIDMSDYDAVLGNIYDENSFIHQHRDTTESVTAEGYPVIVINLGADGHLAYDEDVKSTYPTWKKTGQLDLSNGGIYAFGVDGVNRFTFHHRIGQGLESANPLKPITLPDGTTLKNYRITLTFRRASDLEKGMPATPKKLSTTQGTQAPVSEVTNTGTQYPNKPEFNKLPAKLDKPTMTYAGIGSRETPAEILAQMTEVARELEGRGYTLNTGVSFKNKKEGADEAFYKGTALLYNLFSPEKQGSRTREQAIAKEVHPNPSALTEGALKLMARNTNQVFGDNLGTPVDFVLFYAKETNNPLRPQGGTGQAVEMARRKGIVTINMADPNWRSQLDAVISKQSPVSETTVSLPTGKQMTGEQWKAELSAIYSSKDRTESEREWTIKQLNFRDQSRSIGATDEQILNTIKCL